MPDDNQARRNAHEKNYAEHHRRGRAVADRRAGLSPTRKKKCTTELKDHKNLIVNLVTIPFKMVATFSHLPRCLIDHFPVNEEN